MGEAGTGGLQDGGGAAGADEDSKIAMDDGGGLGEDGVQSGDGGSPNPRPGPTVRSSCACAVVLAGVARVLSLPGGGS
jgi:hypothetical protein